MDFTAHREQNPDSGSQYLWEAIEKRRLFSMTAKKGSLARLCAVHEGHGI
jgi:hypothetical protein